MRINGKISPSETKRNIVNANVPRRILIQRGNIYGVNEILEETALVMEPEDVCLISTNAIDSKGNTTIMAGVPLGMNPGKIISDLMVKGATLKILVGFGKLIPCKISRATMALGRKKPDITMKISAELITLIGRCLPN